MVPNTKSRLVDQPPSASSSEEQELVEESQEEEEQQSGEEEGEENEEPKTAHPVVKRSLTQKLQFSSESGSENGSGSESEAESGHSLPSPSASDFTVKPSVPAKAAAPSKSVAKRPQEAQKEKGRKKPKIVEEEEKKSAATPRFLWSDDDQLALLKGIAEYKAVEGMEPKADMSAFHEFIRGKLQVEVSKSQLSEKLKRLKKKFLTNVKGGEEPVFMKGQDSLVFQHSKRIWGAPGTSNGVKEIVTNSTNDKAKKAVEVKMSSEPKKSAKVSKPKDDENHKEAVKEVVKEDIVKGDQQDFQSEYPRLAASFESMAGMSTMYPNGTSFLKENMSLIATDKAKVLEEKWKKLEDDEAALMVKRLDLIAEHYGLVVDAMRGSSLNVKSASAVNDADPHKSSEADAELSKPEMNANAHAPLPHPPGKSAPPLPGPPPSLPPKPPTPSPPPPPKVRPLNPPKPGNFPKSLPLRAHQRGCSSETRGSDSLDLMLLKQN
ncbi:neurofilament heavy polypeptide-like isoform X1 [Solanum tuberosum]|uniref:neurofilament heavy polypeptide-like isoform X1 n=2 Tax=Solanum tuberosum TaxID=4113 RepID=UPI0003D257FE|nr:PREDICTED: neurofilament heavy polypeptide-like isoform X1 [Solanum tuberosum]